MLETFFRSPRTKSVTMTFLISIMNWEPFFPINGHRIFYVFWKFYFINFVIKFLFIFYSNIETSHKKKSPKRAISQRRHRHRTVRPPRTHIAASGPSPNVNSCEKTTTNKHHRHTHTTHIYTLKKKTTQLQPGSQNI